MLETKPKAEASAKTNAAGTADRRNWKRIWLENRRTLFPLLALILIVLGDWLISPNFFSIRVVDGRFVGSPISILDLAAPIILLSIGMTLVIATKGVDLSVGAVMAICRRRQSC